MIKYLGSKRLLLPHITAAFGGLQPGDEVLDLFSGTARVGHALKAHGFRVHANDHNAYAHTLARCYVATCGATWSRRATELLLELAQAPAEPGWFTETYAQRSRFFHPINAARIEGIRHRIAALQLPPPLEAIALVSLMEAADRVDSTTGVQMAYLKAWAARAHRPLELRLPRLLAGEGAASGDDALAAARAFQGRAAYLDPPYNQHSYRGNYHIWETLTRWDQPTTYGKAMKREDCRVAKSDFNSKRRIRQALESVLAALRVEVVVMSFNNEGHLDHDEIASLLGRWRHVACSAIDYKRYVGAQIGIFNLKGERVGTPTHLRNTEFLFIASDERALVERGHAAVQATLAHAA